MILVKILKQIRFQLLSIFLLILAFDFFYLNYISDIYRLFALVILLITIISLDTKLWQSVAVASFFLIYSYNNYLRNEILVMEKVANCFFMFLFVIIILKLAKINGYPKKG